jgi:hypothetical protein
MVTRSFNSSFAIISTPSIQPDGSFNITNLGPGDYVIRASGPPTADALAPDISELRVRVDGDDLDNVLLAPPLLSVASGKLTVAGRADERVDLRSFRISLVPRTPPPDLLGSGPVGSGPVDEESRFSLKTPSGTKLVRITGPTSDWSVRRVKLGDEDLTDRGVEIENGRNVAGLQVEITDRIQELLGQVTDASGAALSTPSTVFVFSQIRERWQLAQRYSAIHKSDQVGHFSIRTLPPGDYYAIALEGVDSSRRADRSYLELLSTMASRLTLTEGQQSSIALKLVAGKF